MPVDLDRQVGSGSAPFDRYLQLGCLTVLTLVLGIGGWAALASISGAVIAPGVVVVEGQPKTIQHSDGGIVGEILVRDGDRVDDKEVLIRLDATQIKANVAIVESKLHEAFILKARLEAELSGAVEPLPPVDLWPLLEQPSIKTMIGGQRELFEVRLTARKSRIQQLELRVQHSREQIDSFSALHRAKQKEAHLVAEELASLKELQTHGHASSARVREVAQEAARLEGETAEYLAQRAQAKGVLAEAKTEILQIRNDFREQVAGELREVTSVIRELKEEQTALLDKLDRIDIRSPASGIVHSLNMHTVGGVIAPTEPIMQIIPREDRLTIEAQVEPQHIDQLYIGQPATLRFPAFNQRTTPELDGHVINISADRLEDQMSGLAYYRAIIEIPKDQIARLNGLALLPGMPVEGFIKTDKRTVLSYFVKPLTDQLQRAFREE